MQHRIFLVKPRAELPWPVAHRHWTQRHGDLFIRIPGLLGYVQNRPIADCWEDIGGVVCSETLFADRAAERLAYQSDYYLNAVTDDEADFLDRGSVFAAVVLRQEFLRGSIGSLRVLLFGADSSMLDDENGCGLERYELDRSLPGMENAAVTAVWTDEPQEALALSARWPETSIVSRPAVYLRPPGWLWDPVP